MCEITKSQRRTYRDQDPPRINEKASSAVGSDVTEEASGNNGTNADPDIFEKERQHSRRKEPANIEAETGNQRDSAGSPGRDDTSAGVHGETNFKNIRETDNNRRETTVTNPRINQVPYSSTASGQRIKDELITNGAKKEDSCEVLTNGREMAPVMGVPPPPPPAPHMGPDGLILPRKPYNPCLISNNHKDLRKELLFNQKIGRNVLSQKSELQRALEKQRETAMRKEAQRNREETYKDDPRTALQRALEQRAKHIQLTEQPQIVEPPNPLVTARAKLRTRTDSQ